MKVHSSSEHELQTMECDYANPKNALTTIEGTTIKQAANNPQAGFVVLSDLILKTLFIYLQTL